MAASLSGTGLPCLFASGEESRRQVSARAHRLGIDGSILSFVSGRELPALVEAARAARPFLLAVDSIQALRDPSAGQVPGGPSQVRGCADALVGFAKAEGISVLMTGHVTKDGDLAGPRALEHAVDVVLAFDGDPGPYVRYRTLVLHWDGNTWSQLTTPNPSEGGNVLFDVSADSATDAWAVGDASPIDSPVPDTLIVHWNGAGAGRMSRVPARAWTTTR